MKTIQYLPTDINKQWPIVSQHPTVADPSSKAESEREYLPELVNAWRAVEKGTGYRWRSTSYWRMSPSHSRGISLDIAPDISPSDEAQYAVSYGSDPVLYKREKLLRDLQDVCASYTSLNQQYSIGIFVEPDHLHMQVFLRSDLITPMRLYKWKVPKKEYADTLTRMELPLIKT